MRKNFFVHLKNGTVIIINCVNLVQEMTDRVSADGVKIEFSDDIDYIKD